MLFKKKVAAGQKAQGDKKEIVGFTKQKKFLFFKIKSKPIYNPQEMIKKTMQQFEPGQEQEQPKQKEARKSALQVYLLNIAAKHKDLELALRDVGIKKSPYDFVKSMFIYALVIAAILTVTLAVLMAYIKLSVIFALVLGIAIYYVMFNKFITYPISRSKNVGKEVERDILFAARDLVIGLRSGMPLFNTMSAVSTGYGAASREFSKIIELVELGMPIEQAMDEVSNKSESKTFKRIMLQASVSIKSGADVVGSLQSVVDEVTQERAIELRRYGQRLNALAMFYMLFGVIFPSMGIAVAAILTTFIALFSITETTLMMALVGIAFLQLIFLNLMRTSRPVFTA
ncbi:MAG: type II secretion system F family protein [Candidatus Micrarchaeia archaeon]